MDHYSPLARATRIAIYVLAVTVPVVIALAVVGTTPYLLDKVPERHRNTVAAIGEGAVRLSGGNGGIFRAGDARAVDTTIPGAPVPLRGGMVAATPGGFPAAGRARRGRRLRRRDHRRRVPGPLAV